MIFRTDLALENREAEGSQGLHLREQDGCRITTLVVEKQEEARYQKPQGTYITVEMEPFSDHLDREDRYRSIVTEELNRLLPPSGTVLVAGLGNRAITPDALGPKTADRVLATRHITRELQRLTGNDYFRPVVTVIPNVLGNTGMEAVELLNSLTNHLKPSAVIVVDALASRSLHRLGCTVQLSDGGIAPGSGVGNTRPAINRETMGVPVIAIGVPTVVDVVTLASELLEENGIPLSLPTIRQVSPGGAQMVVTPREIDLLIDRAASLVSMAINTSLNPSLEADIFAELI